MNEYEESLIEKYIEGSLTESESDEVQQLMQTSEEFAQEVSFQKRMLAHLEANLRNEQKSRLLSELQEIKAEESGPKTIRLQPKVAWYSIAASIVVVLGVLSFYNWNQSNHSEVYMSYYQPYDGIVNTRGEVDEDSKPIEEVIHIYNLGEYQIALENLLKIDSLGSISKGQYALLVANCYLNLDQAGEGLEWLEKISEDENSLVKANKHWYIALSYLKEGQVAAAKEKLEEIVAQKSVYSRKARQLLAEDLFN